MKRTVLLGILVVVMIFAFFQRFSFVSGSSKDGKWKLVLVNKSNSTITRLIGGK